MNFIFIYLKINVTPYNIPDQGLGQDTNVVLGLAEQYGLLPGTKLSADNLFNSDHMSEKELGLVGTLRHNQVVGVPLPSKKEATKNMARGTWRPSTATTSAALCGETPSMSSLFLTSLAQTQLLHMYKRFAGASKGCANIP